MGKEQKGLTYKTLMGVRKWLIVATWLKLRKEALLTASKVLWQVPDTKLEILVGDPLPLLQLQHLGQCY